MRSTIIYKITALLLTLAVAGLFIYAYLPERSVENFSSEKLLALVQEWREYEGLEKYIVDWELCQLADTRLSDTQTDWSHDQFTKRVDEFLVDKDFDGVLVTGENLTRNLDNEKEALSVWVNSPTHLENLESTYSHTCISCSGKSCVQIFSTDRHK